MIVLAGPTASGKSELAASLAAALDGEVVSADARQVYRFLDAATAKPSASQRAKARHWLLDCADPSERFDAGRFVREASAAIADIRRRGKLPLVCGGTGLYLRALTEGLSPLPPADENVRARLSAQTPEALHARLAEADPVAAKSIPANNRQRVIRALEVLELTGKPISESWAAGREGGIAPDISMTLELSSELQRARIEDRCRAMWPALLAEVRELVPARFAGTEPGFSSLGYREALAVASGEATNEDGFAAFRDATNAYAKRQRTWFRRQPPLGEPLDASAAPAAVLAAALAVIGRSREKTAA